MVIIHKFGDVFLLVFKDTQDAFPVSLHRFRGLAGFLDEIAAFPDINVGCKCRAVLRVKMIPYVTVDE
jgi:hypothetical protein